MITTVTLNPCTDRTVELKNLTLGEYNLVDTARSDVSGKGINVSVVLHNLGIPTKALFLDYEKGGGTLKDFLNEKEIPFSAVSASGEMRMNLKLTDTAQGVLTEVNERGAPVDERTLNALLTELSGLLKETDILVVTGSVPPGIPEDIYGIMIRMAENAHVKTVLDASGELFRKGITAHPWLVKPNQFELETYFREKTTSPRQAILMAKKLLSDGAETVCLSLGKEGAALISREESWYSPGIEITPQGFQGAGDSLVAGLCAAYLKGYPMKEQLRWAVAAAHASLILSGTQLCRRQDFEIMLKKIPVEKVD